MMMKGATSFGGKLSTRKISAQRPHTVRSARIPGVGRLAFSRDPGHAPLISRGQLMSNLTLVKRGPDGVIQDVIDTGSGLVTNAGVNVMSFDYSWANATLKVANQHALGTGTTAAAATDAWLQTIASNTNFAGVTNGYIAGTQSIIANATATPWSPIYQTTATFTCNGGAGIAITEWILALGSFANISHAATATSTTSLSDTVNSPFIAAHAQAGTIETGTATPINTPATTPMLQVASQTATVATGIDNSWGTGTKTWLGLNNQAVATPAGTATYVIFPTAFDHKVFGAVTLNNGDSLAVTYQLSINSGG